jgi:hypothetical protein
MQLVRVGAPLEVTLLTLAAASLACGSSSLPSDAGSPSHLDAALAPTSDAGREDEADSGTEPGDAGSGSNPRDADTDHPARDGSSDSSHDAGHTADVDAGPPPTYAEHVAPILSTHCVKCHSPGGIGPFSLTTYAEASSHAAFIAWATLAQVMPMCVDDEPCGLTDAEIATLQAWNEAGAPP